MKILPVLAFSNNDYPQAERLLDLIALQRNHKSRGYILLAAAPDTDAEQQKRMLLAAGLAFEHAGLLTVGPMTLAPNAPKPGKYESMNWLFGNAAMRVEGYYRLPFLWLEPDCAVLSETFLEDVALAYDAQPKRYLGAFMVHADGRKILGRTAVYPADCSKDIAKTWKAKVPFEMAAGVDLTSRATQSKLFQMATIESNDGLEKLRRDAVLLHGDKAGIAVENMIASLQPEPVMPSPDTLMEDAPKRRGRPPKTAQPVAA